MKNGNDPIRPIISVVWRRCKYGVESISYEKIIEKVWNYGSVTLPIRSLIKTEINLAIKRINES